MSIRKTLGTRLLMGKDHTPGDDARDVGSALVMAELKQGKAVEVVTRFDRMSICGSPLRMVLWSSENPDAVVAVAPVLDIEMNNVEFAYTDEPGRLVANGEA